MEEKLEEKKLLFRQDVDKMDKALKHGYEKYLLRRRAKATETLPMTEEEVEAYMQKATLARYIRKKIAKLRHNKRVVRVQVRAGIGE